MRVHPLCLPAAVALLGAASLPLVLGADEKAPALDPSKLPPAATAPVDFARDVRPILAERCVSCHGAKKHQGGLRLHTRADALAGGDNGAVLVAGKGAESKLVHNVAGLDPDAIMPPEGKGEPLTAAQVGLLRAWIDQGAKWPDDVAEVKPAGSAADAPAKVHWAYKKPERREPPAVSNPAWVRNAIDNFVLTRLDKEGLKPSPEADRATLLRRVSLDLTGLPPTPEEVDAFLADTSPDAYEKQVDRLLASPAYGERWAQQWLDLARYADTFGYERDHVRTMWPYRDWVVDALNRDVPFDQFTVEQLAGDLLPNATIPQKVATGFHRNSMMNSEDGSDDEEWRVAAVVDRVNTTGTVWLGTTIACAQCHTHKYDPFTMKEYYQFFAFLNNTTDGGNANKGGGPDLEVPVKAGVGVDPKKEIAELEAKLRGVSADLNEAQAKWEKRLDAELPKWTVLGDAEFSAASGATAIRQPDGSFAVTGAPAPERDTYMVRAKTDVANITGIRLEVLPDSALPAQGPGRAGNGNFVLSEIAVSVAGEEGAEQAPRVELRDPVADFNQAEWAVAGTIDGNDKTGWGVLPQAAQRHVAIWSTKSGLTLKPGESLTVKLDQQYGQQHTIGRFRLSVTSSKRPLKPSGLPENVEQVFAIEPAKRTNVDKVALFAHFRAVAPETKPIRDRIARLKAGERSAKTLVLQERATPRKTHVMIRGSFQNPGDAVSPGVPSVLNPMPKDAPPNRLGMAKWLVDPENPLTSRVAVNRLWESYFGTGIVKTSEDFGTQSEPPSHPELLDWLATEYVRQAWGTKAMHRLIVTSSTYRQSSRVTPALLEKDPANRLFARGPRVRLEAEMIRDQALSIAGLLSKKMGGPPVMPPQPDGVWNRPYSGARWQTSDGEDRYRRALYTFWRRTAAYPSMTTFDAPSREVCTVRRPRTNTPLQALTVLNDPVYVEAAHGLARRVLASPSPAVEDRVAYAVKLALGRPPEPAERERLVDLFRQELEHYKKDPAAAKAFVTKASPVAMPQGTDVSEAAAWMVVGNVLLNLDEMVTKG